MTTYTAIRRAHEVNDHKGEHEFINAYSKAGWMCPKVSEYIKRVLLNCKICQKFAKSVSRPKVSLPKSNSFDEVVNLDLKAFGSKPVLWMIVSFSRFVQGKVIQNKRAETIVKAVMDMWILCFGIPSVGFYTDNGGEFGNVNIDKLIARLGITIRYGPAYSPWFNGIN